MIRCYCDEGMRHGCLEFLVAVGSGTGEALVKFVVLEIVETAGHTPRRHMLWGDLPGRTLEQPPGDFAGAALKSHRRRGSALPK